MNTYQLKRILAGLPLGEVHYYRKIGSTNDAAMDGAASGAPDLSLFTADQQTAGRGRLQRPWVTNSGAALAFSLTIRPTPQELDYLPLFSPWAGVALCLALEELGLQPQIKWPNDVLLERMKVAGILLESNWTGEDLRQLVIGVGVNVTPAAVPPPNQIRFPAASVEGILGRSVDRWVLLRGILNQMVSWRPKLSTPEFRRAWEGRLAFLGEWVQVGNGIDPSRLGQVQGIDRDGNLILLDPAGHSFTVQVGEVSLRPT